MKNLVLRFALAGSLVALAGCTQDSAHRDETPGEKAGRAAYVAQKDAKKAAKELQQDLKSFSRDARAGYEEEKQKNQERKRDGTDTSRDVPKDER